MVKKTGIRFILLLAILTVSNFIYRATTYSSDLRAEGNVLTKFEQAVDRADILYFSASPNAAIGIADRDQRTIAQMTDDLIPDLKLMAVDTGGIHAGVYKKLVQMIPEDSPVKTVVINMNYRSFGVDWIYSKLENAIQKQMVFYHNRPAVINRFLQGLNYYEARTDHERERLIQDHWSNDLLPFAAPKNTVTSWCEVEKWGDWTHPKRQLADHYIKNFAFVLNEENPRVKDFDEIVEIAFSKDIQLIFVVLPENIQEAEKLVDTDLKNLMIDNKNWLVNRYESAHVKVVDCFELVADSCFIERDFPSEHYTETGRFIIASAIANAINP
jgi:hypothetical protein